MYDSRVNLYSQVFAEIKKHFNDKLYQSIIPRNIRLAEAPSYGKPALLYDQASRGCQVYLDLAVEIMEINRGWERLQPFEQESIETNTEGEKIETVTS